MQQSFKTFNAEMKVYDVDLDLLAAVENNDLGRMNDALALGADPACIDRDGRSPLNAALLRGYDKIALELIAAGAPVNAYSTQYLTPLRAAMKGGHLSSVKILLAEGADPHGNCPDADVHCNMPDYMYAEKHCTPETAALVGDVSDRKWLKAAVTHNLDWQVEEYLKKGVPADMEMEPGVTCLFFAAKKGYASTVRKLLESGADASKKGPDGRTAMHAAAIANSADTIEALGEKDVSVYAVDDHGKTPLAYANGEALRALERCSEKEVRRMMHPALIRPMSALRFRPKF